MRPDFFKLLVAYTFAKRKLPGRDTLFLLMLGTLMIPGQFFLIPNDMTLFFQKYFIHGIGLTGMK